MFTKTNTNISLTIKEHNIENKLVKMSIIDNLQISKALMVLVNSITDSLAWRIGIKTSRFCVLIALIGK